jgi:hypothetical protein
MRVKTALLAGSALSLGAFIGFVDVSVLVSASAWAADAATIVAPVGSTSAIPQPDGTVVFLRPLIDGLMPFIITAFGAVITGLGYLINQQLKRRGDAEISAATLDRVRKAAETLGGVWYAKQQAGVANLSVDVHSTGIKELIDTATEHLGTEMAAVGVTPERVGNMILGKIGDMQAAASAVPPTNVPPVQMHDTVIESVNVTNNQGAPTPPSPPSSPPQPPFLPGISPTPLDPGA